MTPMHGYTCPDCQRFCMDGETMHQHTNGEWVHTDDLRRFYQFLRWIKWASNSELLSLWERS